MANNQLVIVGGGTGTRMDNLMPKQFITIAGAPILAYTINAFEGIVDPENIVLVLPEDRINYWNEISKELALPKELRVVKGGKSRFHSVKNGLALLKNEGVIGVHDAVRPFASKDLINNCFKVAKEKGSAVPVIKPGSTVRKLTGNTSTSISREDYRIVQTPQCFSASALIESYEQVYSTSFSDDATVVEQQGMDIHLVDGEESNIKITIPEDLIYAEAILHNRESEK